MSTPDNLKPSSQVYFYDPIHDPVEVTIPKSFGVLIKDPTSILSFNTEFVKPVEGRAVLDKTYGPLFYDVDDGIDSWQQVPF